jgi:hypothetical protein
MIVHFQAASRLRFSSLAIISPDHPLWTKGGRKVYLNTPREVWTRIRYVDDNPGKDELARQNWPFVVHYDNWPFHKGAKPQAMRDSRRAETRKR